MEIGKTKQRTQEKEEKEKEHTCKSCAVRRKGGASERDGEKWKKPRKGKRLIREEEDGENKQVNKKKRDMEKRRREEEKTGKKRKRRRRRREWRKNHHIDSGSGRQAGRQAGRSHGYTLLKIHTLGSQTREEISKRFARGSHCFARSPVSTERLRGKGIDRDLIYSDIAFPIRIISRVAVSEFPPFPFPFSARSRRRERPDSLWVSRGE